MWPIILLVIFTILLHYCQRPKYFPPGPTAYPIVGNVVSVWLKLKSLKLHHNVWQYWSEKYGDLLGLNLIFTYVVVVSGKDMIKEVCSREVFDGRPEGFFYMMRSFGKKLGIVFSDGPSWHKTRRAVLKSLKNFGYGSRSMEAKIAEECQAVVKLRLADAGKPIAVNQMFDVSIVNILWRIVAGKRYELNDMRLKNLCNLITKSFRVVDMSGGVLNFMPFLRHFIPGIIGYTELKEIHESLYKFIRETIEEHKENLNLKNPKDVIDTLLIENIENKGAFTDEQLQVVCLDLLEAGAETVANTFVFTLLYIVLHDNVQNKLHNEIDDTIGKRRLPSLDDRERMVYTEAVLLEGLRMSTVPAVGIPHVALEDATLGNYVIRKGTLILLAMHSLHNGKHWRDPHLFMPERFLTKEGNIIQDDWLLPFGIGRRRCIGEALARSELFMFTTHILQRFRLKLPSDEPQPTMEPLGGVALHAKPFRLIFEPRF